MDAGLDLCPASLCGATAWALQTGNCPVHEALDEWASVSGATLDPRRAYLERPGSGMTSACKHFPGLWNKQAGSVLTAQLLCRGLPQAGSGAPPQALFLVPPTASSGTSAPSALPQVPWPEFLPLSAGGVPLP